MLINRLLIKNSVLFDYQCYVVATLANFFIQFCGKNWSWLIESKGEFYTQLNDFTPTSKRVEKRRWYCDEVNNIYLKTFFKSKTDSLVAFACIQTLLTRYWLSKTTLFLRSYMYWDIVWPWNILMYVFLKKLLACWYNFNRCWRQLEFLSAL